MTNPLGTEPALADASARETRARRNLGGVIVGAVMLVVAGVVYGFVLTGLPLLVGVVTLSVLAVLLAAGGVINALVATRFPEVKRFGGPIDLVRISAALFGPLTAGVMLIYSPNTIVGIGRGAGFLVITLVVHYVATLSRTLVRGPDAR